MQTTIAILTLATAASAAIGSTPSEPAPAGCSASYDGQFEITIINSTSTPKRHVKRQSDTCGQPGIATLTLKDGVLKDNNDRQGEITGNQQFQFDKPLQQDAIYTAGFSVCNNGSMALGGSSVFWECQTTGGPGIGTYSNLYAASTGAQCNPILINIIPCKGGSGGPASSPAVSQISDGQTQATGTAPPPPPPVSQISDGQIQLTSIAPPVSQISDGQVQATGTGAPPVSQISDGQVQATGAAPPPVSQISDGQVQATGAAPPVSQISDGQIQATGTAPPVSQISDGQIQATGTAKPPPVSQISDGQIQATGVANATTTPKQVSGNSAAGLAISSTFGVVMAGAAAAFLL